MKKVEGVAEIAHGLKSKDTSEEKNDTTIAEPASQSQ